MRTPFQPRILPPALIRAFSLTEIIVALGIISIALVSLMGLISASLKTARESTDDTVLASVIQSVSSQVRALGYKAVSQNTTLVSGKSYYFDATGNLLRKSATGEPITSEGDARAQKPWPSYSCKLTLLDPAKITGVDTGVFPQAENDGGGMGAQPVLRIARAELVWPPLITLAAGKGNLSQQRKYFFISLTKLEEPIQKQDN